MVAMKITRERKIYLGMLALGLAALSLDRVLTDAPGPRSASASVASSLSDAADVTAASPVTPVTVMPTAPAIQPTAGSQTPRLAQRLAAFGREQGIAPQDAANAFVPSSQWLDESRAAVAAQVNEAIPAGPSEAEQFLHAHKLNGIIADKHGGLAIVNGKPVALGQSVGGFRLTELHPRHAVFTSTDGEVVKMTFPAAAGQ